MKKENLGSVKALKKQLGAAVAMVCVAAVALGSSTYAWFVTNNEVTAKTTSIKAQSNAAFMSIEEGLTGASTSDAKTASQKDLGNVALFQHVLKLMQQLHLKQLMHIVLMMEQLYRIH